MRKQFKVVDKVYGSGPLWTITFGENCSVDDPAFKVDKPWHVTPGGFLTITATSDEAPMFELGKDFYLDLTPA